MTQVVSVVLDGRAVPFTVGLAAWCPVEKKLVLMDTYAPGGAAKSIVTSEGNRIVFDSEGIDEDGKETKGKYIYEINSADELVVHFREGEKGGEPTPDWDVTFNRVDTTSTREEFEEYCQVMQGRWIGEVSTAAELLGLSDSDGAVTCYGINRVVGDGTMMQCDGYQGAESISCVIAYDASVKKIVGWNGSSTGSVWKGINYKKDGKWHVSLSGSTPDGTSFSGIIHLDISDEGNTHTWKGTINVEGAKPEKLDNTWRRVSK